MRKQITYFEPHFNPYTHEYDDTQLTRYDIIANTGDELNAIMSAITDPARGITDITTYNITDDISNLNINADQIRQWRDEAFTLIDKYQLTLMYESLTATQKADLTTYRQQWLDAPETMIIPETPDWMSGKSKVEPAEPTQQATQTTPSTGITYVPPKK